MTFGRRFTNRWSQLWRCHTHGMEVAGSGSVRCYGSDAPAFRDDQIFSIDVAEYPGGIAAWGATAPAAYWGSFQDERGVHVHARRLAGGTKEIDQSFALVRVTSGSALVQIDEASAVARLVSLVAGHENVVLACPHCEVFW